MTNSETERSERNFLQHLEYKMEKMLFAIIVLHSVIKNYMFLKIAHLNIF